MSVYGKLLMLVIGMSLAYNDILWVFDGYVYKFLLTVLSSDIFLLGMILFLVLVEAGRSAARTRNRCGCRCAEAAGGDTEYAD